MSPLLAAFILGLSVAAPLGPVSAAAIREGMERGAAGAFQIGLGAATVDFVYMGLVYVGVAPLLLRAPWLVTGFYLAGALLLGSMARSALGRAWSGAMPEAGAAPPARNGYLHGLGMTLLNPATIIAWLGLGGAFAGAHLTGRSPAAAVAVLLAVFAGSSAWFGVLALLVGGARRLAGGRPWVFRAVNLAAGLALGAYGLFFLIKAMGRG